MRTFRKWKEVQYFWNTWVRMPEKQITEGLECQAEKFGWFSRRHWDVPRACVWLGVLLKDHSRSTQEGGLGEKARWETQNAARKLLYKFTQEIRDRQE